MDMKSAKSPAKSAPQARQAVKAERETSPAYALSPFGEMDLFFDRLSNGLLSRMGFPALADTGWPFLAHAPRVDLLDRGKDLVLRAEIPGISKDDLEISLRDGTVTICGHSSKETREEKGDYHRREISRGSFQRTVPLSADVAADKCKASFKDGVLELVMPKTDKPSGRHIPID
jgi:HSP20 family protein